jgi:hypothetical protein
MPSWSFLTNHARVLLCIARDRGVRLRDVGASLGITERSAHAIVTDLTEAGYVVKQKDGRRNRYQIDADRPLSEAGTQAPAVGEVLALLLGHAGYPAGPPDRAPPDRAPPDSEPPDSEPPHSAPADNEPPHSEPADGTEVITALTPVHD